VAKYLNIFDVTIKYVKFKLIQFSLFRYHPWNSITIADPVGSPI